MSSPVSVSPAAGAATIRAAKPHAAPHRRGLVFVFFFLCCQYMRVRSLSQPVSRSGFPGPRAPAPRTEEGDLESPRRAGGTRPFGPTAFCRNSGREQQKSGEIRGSSSRVAAQSPGVIQNGGPSVLLASQGRGGQLPDPDESGRGPGGRRRPARPRMADRAEARDSLSCGQPIPSTAGISPRIGSRRQSGFSKTIWKPWVARARKPPSQ